MVAVEVDRAMGSVYATGCQAGFIAATPLPFNGDLGQAMVR